MIKTARLILFKEKTGVYCENHRKTKENLFNVELGGAHTYQFLYQYLVKTNSHISYTHYRYFITNIYET